MVISPASDAFLEPRMKLLTRSSRKVASLVVGRPGERKGFQIKSNREKNMIF